MIWGYILTEPTKSEVSWSLWQYFMQSFGPSFSWLMNEAQHSNALYQTDASSFILKLFDSKISCNQSSPIENDDDDGTLGLVLIASHFYFFSTTSEL